MANKLAKKYNLPFTFRFRMRHGRHLNLKERFIANCTQKVFDNVKYLPTDRNDEEVRGILEFERWVVCWLI